MLRRRRAHPPPPRARRPFAPYDLEGDGPFAEVLLEQMRTDDQAVRRRAWGRFELWGRGEHGEAEWQRIWGAASDGRDADGSLAVYGQYLFDNEGTVTSLKYTILVAQDREAYWRYARAWRVLRSWQQRIPGKSFWPLPEPAVAAIFVGFVFEGWWDLAFVFLLAWACALRPGEWFNLVWEDLVHFSDSDAWAGPRGAQPDDDDAFVVIATPKTRRRGARKQYVSVHPRETRALVAAAQACGNAVVPVCGLSTEQGNNRFQTVLKKLGLPAGAFVGYTPASVRAGRATSLYRRWDRQSEAAGGAASERMRRFLRQENVLTTERYIQEVGASTAVARLTTAQRTTLVAVGGAAPAAVRLLCEALRRGQWQACGNPRRPVRRVLPAIADDGDSD